MPEKDNLEKSLDKPTARITGKPPGWEQHSIDKPSAKINPNTNPNPPKQN